jgi:hypothetical protein
MDRSQPVMPSRRESNRFIPETDILPIKSVYCLMLIPLRLFSTTGDPLVNRVLTSPYLW